MTIKAVIDTNILVLVTKNIKHFPIKRYRQVQIVRVSKFLTRLEKEFK
jgi:hypothetical protein